jgi:hypothetical protein
MNTIEMLNALSEYEAQKTLLALDKQALLDTVKVPAEVIAAQDEANRARQEVDDREQRLQADLDRRKKNDDPTRRNQKQPIYRQGFAPFASCATRVLSEIPDG